MITLERAARLQAEIVLGACFGTKRDAPIFTCHDFFQDFVSSSAAVVEKLTTEVAVIGKSEAYLEGTGITEIFPLNAPRRVLYEHLIERGLVWRLGDLNHGGHNIFFGN